VASAQGTATIDFGAFPGSNEASVAVTGQAAISGTSKAEAYIMGDDTSGTHTASDHRWAAALVGLSCGTPAAGTGFTIYGRCLEKMQGPFAVRWIWSD
jgi:hypothetical protein